jgi:hypothetical protein
MIPSEIIGIARPLRTIDANGDEQFFYYVIGTYYGPDTDARWEVRVTRRPQWPKDAEPYFQLRFGPFPERPTTALLVTHEAKRSSEFGKQGIPDALIPEIASLCACDVFSSRDRADEKHDLLNCYSKKMWQRFARTGIATEQKYTDFSRYVVRWQG